MFDKIAMILCREREAEAPVEHVMEQRSAEIAGALAMGYHTVIK